MHRALLYFQHPDIGPATASRSLKNKPTSLVRISAASNCLPFLAQHDAAFVTGVKIVRWNGNQATDKCPEEQLILQQFANRFWIDKTAKLSLKVGQIVSRKDPLPSIKEDSIGSKTVANSEEDVPYRILADALQNFFGVGVCYEQKPHEPLETSAGEIWQFGEQSKHGDNAGYPAKRRNGFRDEPGWHSSMAPPIELLPMTDAEGRLSISSLAGAAGRAGRNNPFLPIIFFLSPLATSVAPRLTPFFVAIIGIALIGAAVRRGMQWRELLPRRPALAACLLFAAYVLLNATWSEDPLAGVGKAALLAALVSVTFAAIEAAATLEKGILSRAAFAFAAGAFLGALYYRV